MIEYPEIMSSSKAPRKPCIAFEKLDGSNIRVKWTQKKGFCLFGTRTQLIDASHPDFGNVVPIFLRDYADKLSDIIKKNWANERELIFFGEYFGEKSFAGVHDKEDASKEFVLFDVLVGHKFPKFLLPQDFNHIFQNKVKTPKVIYRGNLNEEFITDVRNNIYGLNEGVVCKGIERSGAFRGNVWMAKIKTQAYFDRLYTKWGTEGIKKYGE